MYWSDGISLELWGRIATAFFCGGVIGFERQLLGKPAGIRTSVLVCVATMAFVWLGGLTDDQISDKTRVLSQVVTGVGFLGAGVMMTRGSRVHGVTTAAVIWILAAIGAAAGMGRVGAALALTVLTLFALVGVSMLERVVRRLRGGGKVDDPDEDSPFTGRHGTLPPPPQDDWEE